MNFARLAKILNILFIRKNIIMIIFTLTRTLKKLNYIEKYITKLD